MQAPDPAHLHRRESNLPSCGRRGKCSRDVQTVEFSAAKRRHLVSIYARVRYALAQMQEASREGRSPTGVGPPLTPLATEQADEILAPLRDLEHRLRKITHELAPRELAALERPQPLNNTLVWLSNLLDHIRISVDGLQPQRMKKYGRQSAEEADALSAIHAELFRRIEQARDSLDARM